jgi:hypothetical protein
VKTTTAKLMVTASATRPAAVMSPTTIEFSVWRGRSVRVQTSDRLPRKWRAGISEKSLRRTSA